LPPPTLPATDLADIDVEQEAREAADGLRRGVSFAPGLMPGKK